MILLYEDVAVCPPSKLTLCLELLSVMYAKLILLVPCEGLGQQPCLARHESGIFCKNRCDTYIWCQMSSCIVHVYEALLLREWVQGAICDILTTYIFEQITMRQAAVCQSGHTMI